ncbi:hypothetical protein BKA69DRAFT_1060269 [Paraphysoderma sedebokerense]|nr:hypothetical protein BKA69DRAFT_1060269 [Paraphysoderma sedebokerense]
MDWVYVITEVDTDYSSFDPSQSPPPPPPLQPSTSETTINEKPNGIPTESSENITTHDPQKIKTRRYNRYHLQSVFALMGLTKHSIEMSEQTFQQLSSLPSHSPTSPTSKISYSPNSTPCFLPTKNTTVTLYHLFHSIYNVMKCYNVHSQWNDFLVAWKVKSREISVCVLLGGTSGCGKSTFGSLLGSRMSITTVLSTDNVRHLLRNFYSKDECPVLYASSYYAGDAMNEENLPGKDKVIAGFEAQNEMLLSKLDNIISSFAARNESLIIEGVHLSIENIKKLMTKHKNCIPFLVYISNEVG